jgi:uncharacterized membrane protein YhaH (DUF805 family)
MSKQFQLVFEGETLQGFDPDDVRRQVGEHMKLDDTRLENLFSGKRVVLKRGVDEERAHRHMRQFARLGGRLHMEPDDGPPPEARPARPPRPPAAKLTSAPPLPPDSPPTTAPMPMPLSAPPVRSPAPAAAFAAAIGTPDFSLVPTAEEAEERITCPKCGEVQPKGVFCRSCATNMPMGIAARLEAEELARTGRRQSDADSVAIGVRPRVTVGRGLAEQAPSLLGFGFRGRLSRRGYAMGTSVSLLIAWLVLLFAMQKPSLGRFLLAGLVWLPLAAYGVRLAVLRCHDINRSGWWSLLLALPLIGLLAALALALIPSTDGENAHGEMPDEGNKLVTGLVTGACALAIGLLIKPALQDVEAEAAEAEMVAASAPPPLDEAADRVLHTEYAASPGHKAFAATQGAFGWKAGVDTSEEAEEAALSACEAQRQPSALPCEVVDLNGVAVPRYRR